MINTKHCNSKVTHFNPTTKFIDFSNTWNDSKLHYYKHQTDNLVNKNFRPQSPNQKAHWTLV